MVHVEIAAVMMGIDHIYIPPHEQSLNEAESNICNNTWDDAYALMARSKVGLSTTMGFFTSVMVYTTTVRECTKRVDCV